MNRADLMEFYCDKSRTNVFDVGSVIGENEDWYYIVSIDENGNNCSFELIRKEIVFMTQENTEYLNELSAKMDAIECDHIEDFANKQNSITRCIQELVSNKTVVQIELYGSNTVDVEGTIIQWETREIEVALTENRNSTGVARISPDAITRIAWDSYN